MKRFDFIAKSSAGLGAAAASAVPAASDADAGRDPSWTLPRAASLEHWSAWADVPGVAVARVRDGRIASVFAGTRVAGADAPVGAHTIFEAASLSKPVFALAVLQLVRAGRLDLDRPLDDYLPAPYPIADDRARRICARHVLSHTSGLPNWRSRADQPLRLAFDPGARFSYSGEGFYFLQTVVERIVGTGIAAYLEDAVLRPLGMRSSSYVWWPAAADTLARPHDADGRPSDTRTMRLGAQLLTMAKASDVPLASWTSDRVMRALPQLDPPQTAVPLHAFPNVATSLLTTANDYAQFVAAAPLAKALSMFAPQVRVNRAIAWGLGIGLNLEDPEPRPFHWGDNDGYKNFVVMEPATRSGVVVLTNGDRGLNLAERSAEHVVGRRLASSLWVV